MWLWLRFSNQDDLRLNPMGSQFSTTILWNLYSESVRTIKFWDLVEDSHTGGPSLIAIRMENLICFSILILWTLCGIFGGPLIAGGWGMVGWVRKSFFGPAEICIFFHPGFWHIMTCFIDWIFLPLWAIADSDFSPLEIYKNITFPCLLSLLQSTATQITVSVNIFICFKYLFHRMK